MVRVFAKRPSSSEDRRVWALSGCESRYPRCTRRDCRRHYLSERQPAWDTTTRPKLRCNPRSWYILPSYNCRWGRNAGNTVCAFPYGALRALESELLPASGPPCAVTLAVSLRRRARARPINAGKIPEACRTPEQIRKILTQERDHQINLATALGIEVPDVSSGPQRSTLQRRCDVQG